MWCILHVMNTLTRHMSLLDYSSLRSKVTLSAENDYAKWVIIQLIIKYAIAICKQLTTPL